jgi:hypothetical protein
VMAAGARWRRGVRGGGAGYAVAGGWAVEFRAGAFEAGR